MATLELREALDKYSIAVLTADKRGNPAFIGTGFCVNASGKTYFITAAHVADSIVGGMFLGKKNLCPFVSKGYLSRRESDPLDLAVLPITDEQMAEVGAEVIREAMVDRSGVYRDGFHSVMGYPASKNKAGSAISIAERSITSVCYGINTDRIDVDYVAYRKDPELHIAVKYDTAISAEGRIHQPPSLRGVSGSPLWVTQDKFELTKVLLGGFLIEYHRKGKVAFCTKAQHMIGFIRAR